MEPNSKAPEFLMRLFPHVCEKPEIFFKAIRETVVMTVWSGAFMLLFGLILGVVLTVTREDGPAESSLALAEQNLVSGKTQVQYKVASERYQLSGTLPLDAPVFQWK